VSRLINDDHVPPAEIGILYTRLLSSTDPSAGVPALLLERISEAFDQAQIPFCWFSRDSAAKMKFDLQEPSIKMGSIFSAKGIDFEHLFLIDAPGTDKATSTCAKRNLLFVGCTRARDHLTLVTLA
jgi:hypothetical protein